jgi:hypothetical protein
MVYTSLAYGVYVWRIRLRMVYTKVWCIRLWVLRMVYTYGVYVYVCCIRKPSIVYTSLGLADAGLWFADTLRCRGYQIEYQ